MDRVVDSPHAGESCPPTIHHSFPRFPTFLSTEPNWCPSIFPSITVHLFPPGYQIKCPRSYSLRKSLQVSNFNILVSHTS